MATKVKEAGVNLFVVAPGVWGMRDIFVNIYAINNPAENNWWLVDTGFWWSANNIKRMGELLFGAGSKPAAIILTHGHFDHSGSVKKLAEQWDVPVYAHHLETPYLTGESSYPPADATVGGGLIADLSFLYPKGPIDIEERVVSLPPGGRIPGLHDWKYIHTPGHAAGHISLYRAADKVLLAGDAFVTTKSESVLASLLQIKKISGPPKYLTSDWLSAASSVEELANLEPEVVATGHGKPMRGAGMRKSLHNLARDFVKVAVPSRGRYIHQPALMDDSGVVHIPPKNRTASTAPTLKLLGISAAVLLTMLLFKKSKKKRKKRKEYSRQLHNGSSNGKYHVEPATEISQDHLKGAFNKLKNGVAKKSGKVSSMVREELDKIKEPTLEMLDSLKFKLRK